MTEQIKLRVVVDGKVVAYEYVKDGYWCHEIVGHDINLNGVNEGGYVYSGTYPPPGDRERFTGRLDDDDTEIYENDRVGWPNEPRSDVGVVVWSEEWYGWSICHGEVVDNFSDWGGDGLTVIGRYEETV